MAITIRGYAPAPLVTDRRRGVIDAALTGLNYASVQDVRAARERITRMTPFRRFTDWALHHGDKARAQDAPAILYLYKCAEVPHTAPAGLQAADRTAARRTLAALLSPAGKQALRDHRRSRTAWSARRAAHRPAAASAAYAAWCVRPWR